MPGWTSRKTSDRGSGSKKRSGIAIKTALHFAALIPVARLAYLGIHQALGANPIEFITHSTGTWTLVMLLITLSVTPMRRLTGWHILGRFRRMLGLYAFFYGCLHLLTYLWLDQFFDWPGIVRDVYKRPFITAGFAGFMLLLALALTSSAAAIRFLGGRRWQLLHRLIYVAAILGVVHFWWLVKKDITQPFIYASVLTLLLAYRLFAAVWQQVRIERHPSHAGNGH
jgi:methionine sulfoxide reductase heme-binding subunit